MPSSYCGIPSGPSGTYSIVENQISVISNYANQAFSKAMDALGKLSDFKPTYTVPTAHFERSTNSIQSISKGALPQAPDASITQPATVEDPQLVEVGSLSPGSAPAFSGAAPSINLPSQPGGLTAQRPGSHPAVSQITLPTKPDDTIPDLPSLHQYSLPEIVDVDLSPLRRAFSDLWAQRPPLDCNVSLRDNYLNTFDTLFPSLVAKQASYIGANQVNNQVITLINEFLGGSIGIPASIDEQLWGRDYAEIDRNVLKANRQAREEWSARGETMVAGVLDFRLAFANQEATKAKQGVVRERMIKRNEWMIENYKAILQQGIAFLDMERKQWLAITTLTEQMAFHAFDVSARIAEFDVKVKELLRSFWQTEAAVFDTWLKTELAELEKVRQELEAQKLVSDINKDLLGGYQLRLEGIKTKWGLYKDEIESLNLILGQDKLRFDSFEATVRAFTAEVQAWATEWDGYGKAIEGELGKERIYATMAQAFAEQMKGYSIGQETIRENEKIKIDNNRLQVELFGRKIERFRELLQAEIAKVDASVKVFQGNTQLFASSTQADVARVDSEAKIVELDVRQGEAQANLELKKAEVAIQEMVNLTQLIVQGMSEVGRTSSSLAGSAMSAAHVGASISNQYNDGTACNTNYNIGIQQ